MGPQKQLRSQLHAEGAAPAAFRSRGREHNSSSAGPGPGLTPGQAEARRAQDSKDTPAQAVPQAVQVSAPPPPEHPGPCGLGAAVVTAGADSRAGEPAAATVVVPPGVTVCLGRGGAARGQGPHGINSSHWAVHLAGGGAAPPGAHT